jgi:hypothetical protein
MRKDAAVFSLALSAWLIAQPMPALADIPLGTINFPLGSGTETIDCFNAERNGNSFINFTATNFTGNNWIDFTITILKCPSDGPTTPGADGIGWGFTPPPNPGPSAGLDGGVPLPVTGTTITGTNTIHFDLPEMVPSTHKVTLDIPYHSGVAATAMFELKVDPSSAPEPSSAVLTALGALGLFGWAWRRQKARGSRRAR